MGIGLQHLAQMGLAPDELVIRAFSSDGADQAFDMAVHPRRVGSDRAVTKAQGIDTLAELCAEETVVVANEEGWGAVPGEGFGELLSEPDGGRTGRNLHMQNPSSAMARTTKA